MSTITKNIQGIITTNDEKPQAPQDIAHCIWFADSFSKGLISGDVDLSVEHTNFIMCPSTNDLFDYLEPPKKKRKF